MSMMDWDERGFPAFRHSLSYSNGNLIIPKDGFYFLFSKVSFRINCSTFTHEIKLNSSRYSYIPINLMMDKRRSCVDQKRAHEKNQFSSYLGGVLRLHKKEKVFVSVSDYSSLITETKQNFFGGFMI
ncbi:tumor necrosis factor ligand superfamily member 14-like [Silurus meridionalis]|nr:tumor necrosis factor ligand superfamily member 14-like [Silurus meridionalis]